MKWTWYCVALVENLNFQRVIVKAEPEVWQALNAAEKVLRKSMPMTLLNISHQRQKKKAPLTGKFFLVFRVKRE